MHDLLPNPSRDIHRIQIEIAPSLMPLGVVCAAYNIAHATDTCHYTLSMFTASPTGTQRNNNVITTSKRRRFDVIMALFVCCVSAGLVDCLFCVCGPGEFPTQRPVTRGFDVFFDLRLNKRLSKQPWGWWFETPSWSLLRQCNVITYWSLEDVAVTLNE